MRKSQPVVALVLLLLGTASAQEAVELKQDKPRVGDRVKVTIDDQSTSDLTITVGGKDMEKKETKSKSLVYIDEVLAVSPDAKKPTKLTRAYEKARLSADGKSTTLTVEGKTVLIEKKGDNYSYSVDGKPVDGEVGRMLDTEFAKPDKDDARDVMFPKKPIKPGESWKIDTEKLVKGLGSDALKLDAAKIEANGKLIKVYKEGDTQFGVLEIKVTAPISDLGTKAEVKVKEGSMSVTMSGDGCIDGTSPKGKSTTVMSFKIVGEGAGFEIKLAATNTEKRSVVPAPKK